MKNPALLFATAMTFTGGFMKRLLCVFMVLSLWTASSWAQSAIIGTGTSTTNGSTSDPVERYYNYEHFQIVYTAAELSAAGMPSGAVINAMGFSISESAVSLASYTISMGLTAQTTAVPYISGLPTVKGPFAYTPTVQVAGSFDMIPLDATLTWDGVSSIAINTCTGSNPFTTPYGGLRYTTATSGSITYVRTDGTDNCPNTVLTSYTSRPNIRFDYTSTIPNLSAIPGSLNFGFTSSGGTSAEQSYVLTGTNLTAGPIAVTAPTGFGVSLTTGGPYTTTVNVSYTPPTLTGTTLYVQFAPTGPAADYSANISHVGGGASRDVAVTGTSDVNHLYLQYCTSSATSTADEEIFNVTVGTLNNTSDCSTTGGVGSVLNEYSNYTTTVAAPSLLPGSSNPFSVQVGTCGGNYGNATKIFIDFNGNGNFADAGEEVYVSTASTTGPHFETGNIAIPGGARTGYTMMRVVTVETTIPSGISACGTYSWGETEDYVVNIGVAGANDIAATAVVDPAAGSGKRNNAAFAPRAVFLNVGSATQTGVPVRFKIFDGASTLVYTNNQTISSLASLATDTVTFSSFTPTTAGTYTARAIALNPGDGNPSNDSISVTFNVLYVVSSYPYTEDFEGALATSRMASLPTGTFIIPAAGIRGNSDPQDLLNQGFLPTKDGGWVLMKPTGITNGAYAPEDVLSGGLGWTTAIFSGSVNDWVRGTPAKPHIAGAHSGTMAYVTGGAATYSASENAYVQSPIFDMSSLTGTPTLEFWHNFYVEPGYEGGIVEVSTNGGAVWSRVDSILGTGGNYTTTNSFNWYNSTSTSGPITPIKWSGYDTVYIGHSAGWIRSTTKLVGLAGLPDVRFRFRFGSDGSVQYEGWAFDDVSILPALANDIAATSVDNPAAGQSIRVNTAFLPKATFTNPGSLTQTSIPVRLKIFDATSALVYTNNQSIASLATGVSQQVTFSSFTPTTTGTFTARAFALNPGDLNSANDSVTVSFSVLAFPQFLVRPDSLVKSVTGGARDSILFYTRNAGSGSGDFAASAIMYPHTADGAIGGDPISVPVTIQAYNPRASRTVASPPATGLAPRSEQRTVKGAPTLNQALALLGERAFAVSYNTSSATNSVVKFDLATPGTYVTLGPGSTSSFAGDFGNDGVWYGITYSANNLVSIDSTTGAFTVIGACPPPVSGDVWTCLEVDPTTGIAYGISAGTASSNFYTIDLTTGVPTLIAAISGASNIISGAFSNSGQLYAVEQALDNLVSIDKATGVATVIGATGFDASYAQDAAFDRFSNAMYLAAYNNTLSRGEFRSVNLATGSTTLIAPFPTSQEVSNLAIKGGAITPWLSVAPTSGTIAVSDSTLMKAYFDATDSSLYNNPGNYYGRIEVRATNVLSSINSLADTLRVPVRMFVQPAATGVITVQPGSINFGNVYIGSSGTSSFLARNIGATTVHVTNINSTDGSFIASPTAFTLASLDTHRVNVTFNAPSPAALYSGTLSFTSDASTAQTVALTGTSVARATIAVRPDSLAKTLATNSSATDTVVVKNTGSGPLTWSVSDEITRPFVADKKALHYSVARPPLPKGVDYPPVDHPDTSGGPDAFGYKFIDSDSPGGPTFSWVDMSTTGTALDSASAWDSTGTFAGFDEGFYPIALPTPFSFYGVNKDSLFIGSNGNVMFQRPTGNVFTNTSFPTAGGVIDNHIGVWWDDQWITNGARVYYGTNGSDFVVEYLNVPLYSGTVPNYTYEVILSPNGTIKTQYLAMAINAGTLVSSSIGIEDATGTVGLGVLYNGVPASYMHNSLAIKFFLPDAPWLTENPVSGSVNPGDSVKVAVTYNSTGLSDSTYRAAVKIANNDPSTPLKSVPVRMTVGGTTVTVNTNITAGWNMIANPVITANDTVRHLFPTSLNIYAFYFQSGYVKDTTMENGKGYWGKFPAATTNVITGTPLTRDSITVANGWNMVGSISNPVDTNTIVSVPIGIRASSWFGWGVTGGYVVVTQLAPGKAFWIKTSGPGRFVLANPLVTGPAKKQTSGAGSLDVLNTLTITDSRGGSQTLYFGADANDEIQVPLFEMPPAPPVGALDARFETAAGGFMVQTHKAKVSGPVEFPVRIQSDAYPVTITWKINGGTASYELTDGLGGKVFHAKEMNATGSIKITDSEVGKVSVKLLGDGTLPAEYALSQNYPNPFNPTTTIQYALPVDSRVTVQIYNVLGQRVRTLVSDLIPAGYHVAEWDGMGNSGQQLASGTYFLQLSAAGNNGKSFNEIRKLLLLK